MKLDICMWAKNGEKFLPIVLKRIDKVIPYENVHHKIFVDDSSSDRTVEIAKDFNWSIYPNRLGFVAGGFTEALSHVKTEFFVSVEQDLILSKDWFSKIVPYMEDEKVGVACGIRFSTHPVLKAIEQYTYAKSKDISIGTLDNTIYRTNVIRQVSLPSPDIIPLSVDHSIYPQVVKLGYKWIRDRTVISDHVRDSLIGHLKHIRKYGKISKASALKRYSLFKDFEILSFSPIRGLEIALRTRVPLTLPFYVLQRTWSTINYIERREKWRKL